MPNLLCSHRKRSGCSWLVILKTSFQWHSSSHHRRTGPFSHNTWRFPWSLTAPEVINLQAYWSPRRRLTLLINQKALHVIHLSHLINSNLAELQAMWAEQRQNRPGTDGKPSLSRHVVLLHSAPLLIKLAFKKVKQQQTTRTFSFLPPHLHDQWRGGGKQQSEKVETGAEETDHRQQLPHLCHIT